MKETGLERVTMPARVRTFIYFTRELPGISEDLIQAGFQVYEAPATSEVIALAEQYPCAIVVMSSTGSRFLTTYMRADDT